MLLCVGADSPNIKRFPRSCPPSWEAQGSGCHPTSTRIDGAKMKKLNWATCPFAEFHSPGQ